MSSVSSRKPPSAEPAFDLDYSICDFQPDSRPDSRFLFRRIEEVMTVEGAQPGGRTLDVACGVGQLLMRFRAQGAQCWGLEPSAEMLGLSRWLYPDGGLLLVRGIGETLPFRDGVFDRATCQGSLDHFVHPADFMQEAARILRPDGRLVIALANYESLSCLLGKLRHRVRRFVSGGPDPPFRPYWVPPPDHYHKGDLAFVRALGGPWFELERCYGVSLLWALGGWGAALDRLPAKLADALLRVLDRIAYRAPALSDMIISVWRPRT